MEKDYLFIKTILKKEFPDDFEYIFNNSFLINFLKQETKSIINSKTRSNLGNLYCLYALIKDYQKNKQEYELYAGAKFTELLKEARSLPFGSKIQNHPLNNRINDKFYSVNNLDRTQQTDFSLVLRNQISQKFSLYKLNYNLIVFEDFDLSNACEEIINKFISFRIDMFNNFIEECSELLKNFDLCNFSKFIKQNISLKEDARKFEIISFAIFKVFYERKECFFGIKSDLIKKYNYKLYKLGRTNANDGGIDFLMQPLGEIFQVTEDLNFHKYFLDIEKVNYYKINFIIKTEKTIEEVRTLIKEKAINEIKNEEIVNKYLNCFGKIYTLNEILIMLQELSEETKYCKMILRNIFLYSKIEYNIENSIMD